MQSRFANKSSQYWLVLGFALVYFLAGKLGLRLAIVHPSATALWPGTGLALAAVLFFGYSVWPGIFLGAFVLNLTTAGSFVSSLCIAAGNTLEAVFAAYLVMKFANGRKSFDRAENIFKFGLFAGLLATAVSATFGTLSLYVTGFMKGIDTRSVWVTWWLGDMVGALLVTPCFLLWSSRNELSSSRSTLLRRVTAFLSLILVALFVFSGSFLGGPDLSLKFVCIPFVVWAGVELRRHEVPLALVAFAGIAVASAVALKPPQISNESLLLLQVFLGVAAMTAFVLSAAVSERNRHEDKLREARANLEVRVMERTRELELRIEEQKRTEQMLKDLSARLLQIQDEERHRIARELHDSTGQSLAVLMMGLSHASQMAAKTAPEVASRLEEVERLARAVSDEVRTTSYLLHPPLLDEAGLKSALSWYIHGLRERSKVKVTLEVSESLGRMSPEVEIIIFRVAQECLANAIRHSNSNTVVIRLIDSDRTLTLEVQDRGKGIAPDRLKAIVESRTVGLGLRGMRERLGSLGGEFEILSDASGTLIRSIVPLAPSAETPEEPLSEEQSARFARNAKSAASHL